MNAPQRGQGSEHSDAHKKRDRSESLDLQGQAGPQNPPSDSLEQQGEAGASHRPPSDSLEQYGQDSRQPDSEDEEGGSGENEADADPKRP